MGTFPFTRPGLGEYTNKAAKYFKMVMGTYGGQKPGDDDQVTRMLSVVARAGLNQRQASSLKCGDLPYTSKWYRTGGIKISFKAVHYWSFRVIGAPSDPDLTDGAIVPHHDRRE